jgi:peptide/nickel transport system permease protein
LWNALQGNLGNSLWTQTPVLDEIIRRFPVSFELGLLALISSLIVAMPIGIYSAIRQDTAGDYLARSFSITLIALPAFWIGTLVIVLPSIWWHWAPPLEYVPFPENPIRNLEQFILPALVLGMGLSGITMRMTRTMMLEVLRQDYVRTAWSKGLQEKTVVMRHALKNALIPVVTIIGLQLPILIGGSVILEQIFALPGIGRLLIDVINKRDYAMLSGLNLVMAVMVMLINLLVDLTYAYLDPRVHYR